MGLRIASTVGNFLIFFTFLRVLIGVSLGTQSILLGFGATILLVFIVAFWETRSPTCGIARLRRGFLFFLFTLLLDVSLLVLIKIL